MKVITNALLAKIKEYNPELNDAQLSSRRFGLEALLNELSKAVIYLIIFSVFSLAGYYVLSLFIYSTIRLATGGYHAKSYWMCLVVSLFVFVITVISGQYMNLTMMERTILLVVSLAITIIFAPVKHKNTPKKNLAKAGSFKLLSIIIVIFWCGFTYFLKGAFGVTAVMSIFIEALMQPLGLKFNPIAKS